MQKLQRIRFMNESIWAEEFSSYVSLTIFLTLFLKAYRKDREIKRAAAACEPPPPMDSGLRYRIFRARLNRKYFLLELIVWAFVAFSEIEWLRSLKPSQELDLAFRTRQSYVIVFWSGRRSSILPHSSAYSSVKDGTPFTTRIHAANSLNLQNKNGLSASAKMWRGHSIFWKFYDRMRTR